MERVATLIQKLQDQIGNKAGITQLLVTTEMLQSELLHLKLTQPQEESGAVAVQVAHAETIPAKEGDENLVQTQERTVEVLHVDEAEMEAELAEIKRNAEAKNNMGSQVKPTLQFDPVEEIPTLFHQDVETPAEEPEPEPEPELQKKQESKPVYAHATKENSEAHQTKSDNEHSLNDRLKQSRIELGDSLVDVPIKDLKKAIGVNDRFVFINELFRGDEVMYERSIKTINGFAIYPEAEYWIKRELKLKLGWNERNEIVKQFDQLVKRRFL